MAEDGSSSIKIAVDVMIQQAVKNLATLNKMVAFLPNKVSAISKSFGEMGGMVMQNQKEVAAFSQAFASRLTNIEKVGRDSAQSLTKSFAKIPFQAWALSIMFFGMGIKRVFDQIAKSGINTFQEVMHSGEALTTSFDILTGVFKFLAFTIGNALNAVLEPLIPIITDIVLKIAEWISSNPRLAGAIIILGIVLGGLLMIIGILVLGIAGLLQAFGVIAGFVTTTMVLAFLKFIAIVALVAVLFVAIWQSNLGNFKEFFMNTIGIIFVTFMAIFGHLFKFLGSGWKALTALLNGDTDGFIKYTLQAFKHLGLMLLKAVMGIAAVILNVLAFAWNLVIDLTTKAFAGVAKVIKDILTIGVKYAVIGALGLVEIAINEIITKIEKMINAVRAMAGLGKIRLPRADLSGFADSIERMAANQLKRNQEQFDRMKELSEDLKIGYIGVDDIKRGFGNVDATFGVTKEDETVARAEEEKPTTTININSVNVENPKSIEELLEEVKRIAPTG